MTEENENNDKQCNIQNVIHSLFKEYDDLSKNYIKKYESCLYSVGEIDEMTKLWSAKSDAVEECIKILKKYYV